jgi:hypothetical protein
VSGLAATLDTVDALARLQLIARRRGCRLDLWNLDDALDQLVAFVGLTHALLSCDATEQPQTDSAPTRVETRMETRGLDDGESQQDGRGRR